MCVIRLWPLLFMVALVVSAFTNRVHKEAFSPLAGEFRNNLFISASERYLIRHGTFSCDRGLLPVDGG